VWDPGEQILVRHVRDGQVLMAIPSTVAAADSSVVATWIAPGTPIAYPDGLSNGRLRPPETWAVVLRPWHGEGVLDVTPLERPHMIRHFWHDDGTFRGWYVNLQRRIRATPAGFDTADLQLDLWIDANGEVTWKDEDHLEQAVEYGMFSAEEAESAHAEARRVLDEWPFPTGWEDWRPDPGWELPQLPPGWDVI
jgi:hypothetical protein